MPLVLKAVLWAERGLKSEVPLYRFSGERVILDPLPGECTRLVYHHPSKENSRSDFTQGRVALSAASNRLFQVLDLYWRSPESGDWWYRSRRFKQTNWSFSDALAVQRRALAWGLESRFLDF